MEPYYERGFPPFFKIPARLVTFLAFAISVVRLEFSNSALYLLTESEREPIFISIESRKISTRTNLTGERNLVWNR